MAKDACFNALSQIADLLEFLSDLLSRFMDYSLSCFLLPRLAEVLFEAPLLLAVTFFCCPSLHLLCKLISPYSPVGT